MHRGKFCNHKTPRKAEVWKFRYSGFSLLYSWNVYLFSLDSAKIVDQNYEFCKQYRSWSDTLLETKWLVYCSFHISLSKAFWRELFYYFFISSWNFHDVRQRFLYYQEQNFSLIRQKMRNFPIDPHYKNHPLF